MGIEWETKSKMKEQYTVDDHISHSLLSLTNVFGSFPGEKNSSQ